MQPTNPHVDIIPTGHYEVWIRTVDLVSLKDDIAQNIYPLINATHKASLPNCIKLERPAYISQMANA
jgi:hypothetical protein